MPGSEPGSKVEFKKRLQAYFFENVDWLGTLLPS